MINEELRSKFMPPELEFIHCRVFGIFVIQQIRLLSPAIYHIFSFLYYLLANILKLVEPKRKWILTAQVTALRCPTKSLSHRQPSRSTTCEYKYHKGLSIMNRKA